MRTYRLLSRLLVMAALVVAGAIQASAGPQHRGKLDLELKRAAVSADAGTRAVIVRTAPGSRDAVRQWLTARGYRVRAEHPLIDALTVDVPVSELDTLAEEPSLHSLSSDAVIRPAGLAGAADATARSRNDFLRRTLGLSDAAADGSGVGVALIDSGLHPAPDFGNRIAGFYDLTGGSVRRAAAFDDYGHGTHVAGLIGGNGEYRGVAPGVRFIVFKVLDARGEGRTSDVVRAIEFIVANRRQLAVDVINLSLGHPVFEAAATDPLVQAIEAATRAGLVVVAAAGNFGTNPETGLPGYAGITSPGNAPSAITVGALLTKGTIPRTDDDVAPFSSRGPSWFDAFAKPDVLAPGDRLVSVAAPGTPLYEQWPAQQVTGASGGAYASPQRYQHGDRRGHRRRGRSHRGQSTDDGRPGDLDGAAAGQYPQSHPPVHRLPGARRLGPRVRPADPGRRRGQRRRRGRTRGGGGFQRAAGRPMDLAAAAADHGHRRRTAAVGAEHRLGRVARAGHGVRDERTPVGATTSCGASPMARTSCGASPTRPSPAPTSSGA